MRLRIRANTDDRQQAMVPEGQRSNIRHQTGTETSRTETSRAP